MEPQNKGIKLAVLTSFVSRKAGGLFEVIRQTSLTLNPKPTVYGLIDEFINEDLKLWRGINIRLHKIFLTKSFGLSLSYRNSLFKDTFDVIHLHGLWMYPQLVSYLWKRKFKAPVIISPHGMLNNWALNNSGWKKRIVKFLFANKSLETADCLHALCEEEYYSFREIGLTNPVAIIPNGVEIPDSSKYSEKKSGKKTLLYLGRIHPIKGIENLILALGQLKLTKSDFFVNWDIKVAGWDQINHQAYLEDLVRKNSLSKNVFFVGPAYKDDKSRLFEEADAFILPSLSEGIPMTVLEAWSYKVPVLMTKECNLPDGFTNSAAIEIESNSYSLAIRLEFLNSLSHIELRDMGECGYNLVIDKYNWKSVTSKYMETYRWVLNGKNKPDFIRLD